MRRVIWVKPLRHVAGLALLLTLVPAALPASDRAEARAQVGSLLQQAREDLDAGRHDAALARLGEVRDIEPNNQDAFYYTAKTHLALADTTQALEVLTEGLQRAPMSTRIRLLIVRLRIAERDYEGAESLLAEVFRFKPNNAEGLYLTGLVSLERGDTTKALDAWQAALEKTYYKGQSR